MKLLTSGYTGRMWWLVSVLCFLGGCCVNGRATEWTIQFHTSNVEPEAGTDANVSLVLYGSDGISKELRFPQEKARFERGKVDTFTVLTAPIGDLCGVDISHDNAGTSPNWKLYKIVIWRTHRSGILYLFECNCDLKLDAKEGDLTHKHLRPEVMSPTCEGKRRRVISEQGSVQTSGAKKFQSRKRSALALKRLQQM